MDHQFILKPRMFRIKTYFSSVWQTKELASRKKKSACYSNLSKPYNQRRTLMLMGLDLDFT